MCGIFGVYDREGGRIDAAAGSAMAAALVHRGPDDEGFSEKDGGLVGNRRLSILDLAGGHQPFLSDDGRIAVVQNGEIFNYVELTAEDRLPCRTRSDTEVLLRLYEKHGTGFVPRLNGMFAFAVSDSRSRRLWLVRDRVGVKPLYLHDDGRRLWFASEIKALLAAGIPARLDEEALHHYLTFNYVPPPLTIFRGIRHLRPGHALTIDPSGVREEAWWDLSRVQAEERPAEDWMRDFLDTLSDAVRLRLRSDVPFGAFLSGGVDSSTIVAMMAAHLKSPVKTFTIGFHDPRYDESPYAEEVARRFGTEHLPEKVDTNLASLWPLAVYACDQPHGDASFMPTYRVSQLAARKVKVVLTGDGGDELFAGYDKHADFFAGPVPEGEEAFERAYFDSISLLGHAAKSELYGPELRGRLSGLDSFDQVAPLFRSFRHQDRINRALALDTLLLLPGNNLVKPDRMGMAVSIEARTPFLDYRMIDLAFRMPGALKLKGRETKHVYKRAIEPLLGKALVHRKKQMFTVPVGEWFKGPLAPFMESVLLSPRTLARGHFRRDRIAATLEEHRTGRANHTRLIRALIALEIWHRIFIDRAWDRAPSFPELDLPEPALPAGRRE